MDALRDVLSQMEAEGISAHEMSREEHRARRWLIGKLFQHYSDTDTVRTQSWLDQTMAIPFDKLAIAIKLALRLHPYPHVPSTADLWTLARTAAGMTRQQYIAGRYFEPAREWPPAGKRHALTGGLEVLPAALQISAPEAKPELGDGIDGKP